MIDYLTLDDAIELLRVVSRGISELGGCGVNFSGTLVAGRDGTTAFLRFEGLDDGTARLAREAGFDVVPVMMSAVCSRERGHEAPADRGDGPWEARR